MAKILRYIGVGGPESSFGAPANPLFHLDPASSSLDSPAEQLIPYSGGMGRSQKKIVPGEYKSAGAINFAADLTTLPAMIYFLFGSKAVDGSAIASVTDEQFVTGVGETEKEVTLANAKININTLEISENLGGLVAHDIIFRGEIVEVSSSGVAGTIDHAKGVIKLTGLTASTTYDMDYDHGFFVHTLTPTNDIDLPSVSLELGKDVFEHKFPGAIFNQLTLSVERQLLMSSYEIVAGKDLSDTLSEIPTLKTMTAPPIAYHKMGLKIGDYGGALTDICAKVLSLEAVFLNNAETMTGICSRFPTFAEAGEMVFTGTIGLRFEDTQAKQDFWGGASEPSDDGPVEKTGEITIDQGNWGQAAIKIPRFIYSAVPIQPTGRDKLNLALSFAAYFDLSEDTLLEVVVSNLIDWFA